MRLRQRRHIQRELRGAQRLGVQAMYAGSTNVISDYDSTNPIIAGQVGVWAGSGSAKVKFDNFECRNLAGFYAVDGRFIDDSGNVRVNSGKLEEGDGV